MNKFEVTYLDKSEFAFFAVVVETNFGFKNAITVGAQHFRNAGKKREDITEIRVKKID